MYIYNIIIYVICVIILYIKENIYKMLKKKIIIWKKKNTKE